MPANDPAAGLLALYIAVQADLLRPEHVGQASAAWLADPSVSLPELFARRGWLDERGRAELERLVTERLARHGLNAVAALSDLRDERPSIAPGTIDEQEYRATLSRVESSVEGHVLIEALDRGEESRERYTLSRLHATGGLGQVWLARDARIGREVAFKEIRPQKTGNPAVWARFMREAMITGQLEHPGIVPVYELGSRPGEEVPFYTMRFVRGRTLSEASTAYHERRRRGEATPLDLRELLDAFVGVANAVAYAHSRGVIHRDLKGANVILGDFGEVVVLDWGLAKVVGSEEIADGAAADGGSPAAEAGGGLSGDLSGATLHGQVLGTPAYMAPEQAAGRLEDVDALSDVYGLGAILYEILTGEPPFVGSDVDEVLRRVREEAPVPPRERCPGTPPPLEAICLKALARRPAERYPDAGSLAREVQRYLADEPVEAYPEPWSRRAGRWARRHKPWVAGAAALLLTALVGLSVGTVLLQRKQAEVEHARDRAEVNFRLARGAVDEYLTRVADSDELRSHGLERLRAKLLQTAKDYYETFVHDQGDDPALRADLGSARFRLADIHREMGEMDEALADYKAAIGIFESLARLDPQDTSNLIEVLKMQNALGILYRDTGKADESEAAYRRGLELSEQLSSGGDADDRLRSLTADLDDNLGTMYDATGRGEQGEALHARGLELREALLAKRPDDPTLVSAVIKSHVNIANLYATTGRSAEAIPHMKTATELGEKLVAEHPDVADYRNALGASWDNLGGALILTGRLDEAEGPYRRAFELKERLVRDHPAVLEYRLLLGETYTNLGELDCRQGRHADGLPWLTKSIETLHDVLEREPRHAVARAYLSYTYSWRAQALGALGRRDEALRDWDSAIEYDDRGSPELRAQRDAASRGN